MKNLVQTKETISINKYLISFLGCKFLDQSHLSFSAILFSSKSKITDNVKFYGLQNYPENFHTKQRMRIFKVK